MEIRYGSLNQNSTSAGCLLAAIMYIPFKMLKSDLFEGNVSKKARQSVKGGCKSLCLILKNQHFLRGFLVYICVCFCRVALQSSFRLKLMYQVNTYLLTMGPHFQPDIPPQKVMRFSTVFVFPGKNVATNTWGISASPLKDDIMKWTAVMFGPAGNLREKVEPSNEGDLMEYTWQMPSGF